MNKYKIIIIIGLFLSITIISKVYANANSYSLLGKKIYLDPGHGGIDSGATYKDIYEKDFHHDACSVCNYSIICTEPQNW